MTYLLLPLTLIYVLRIIYSQDSGNSTSASQETSSNENAKSKSEFDKIHGFKISSKEDLNILMNTTDVTYFLFYYKKESVYSKKSAEVLEVVARRLFILSKMLLIDCEEGNYSKEAICDAPPEAFPRMILLVPPEFRVNPYTGEKEKWREIRFKERAVNETGIYNFIADNIISRSIKLSEDNINSFLKL